MKITSLFAEGGQRAKRPSMLTIFICFLIISCTNKHERIIDHTSNTRMLVIALLRLIGARVDFGHFHHYKSTPVILFDWQCITSCFIVTLGLSATITIIKF